MTDDHRLKILSLHGGNFLKTMVKLAVERDHLTTKRSR